MISDEWRYGKASLIGFFTGLMAFFVASPLLTLSYHQQFQVLLACVGISIGLSCVAAVFMKRFGDRAMQR